MTAAGSKSPEVEGPPSWPLPPRQASLKDDALDAKNGEETMVIDMATISDPSEALPSPAGADVNDDRARSPGTEILGWVASAPLIAVMLLRIAAIVSGTLGINDYGHVASQQRFVMSLIWYLCILSAETGLRWSPTLMHILSASSTDSTRQLVTRFTDADTVRLETHMTCYRDSKEDSGVSDISWTGKSKFDCSLVTDNTVIPDNVLERRAVFLEFGSQVEFADSKSRANYDKVRGKCAITYRVVSCRPFSDMEIRELCVGISALIVLNIKARCGL